MFGDKARVEIERKFLVTGDGWRGSADRVRVRQGFLSIGDCTVRVRRVLDIGVITVKGPTRGLSREEYEYEIPREDAELMLENLCQGVVIEKVRTRIPLDGVVWEVDEFEGANQGLIVAEVELESEDQKVSLPSWIGEEVSHDLRYANAHLALHPYSTWPQSS